MENNNKESFKLLGVSASGSDSASEVPEFVLAPPRKKKIKRRLRGTTGSRTRQPQQVCGCHGRTVGLSIATILLISWLVMITWLAVVLHRELKRLDTNVQNVVAGSQAFPDALQKCHSLSRDLQQNQTLLFNNFAMLSNQLQNLSNQLIGMQAGLKSVEERLKAAPELVNLPQDMQSLSTSVASFGSQIRDLNTTVTGLKNDNGQLQELAKTFKENVTTLKEKVLQLVNVTHQLQTPSTENTAEKEALGPVISQLTANMTQMNDTLNKKLQWVIDDQHKDHKLMVDLQDSNQNMSARLTTLEGECVKSTVHSALNNTVDKLIHQVSDCTSHLNEISRQVKQLQSETQQLENSASQLSAQLNEMEISMEPTGIPQTQGTEDSSSQSISPRPTM